MQQVLRKGTANVPKIEMPPLVFYTKWAFFPTKAIICLLF